MKRLECINLGSIHDLCWSARMNANQRVSAGEFYQGEIMTDICYCDSGDAYTDCCQPYLSGARIADTARQLMRSRYCAYVVNNEDYLISTWHSSTRPASKQLSDDKVKWRRLRVHELVAGGAGDERGEVFFEAIYKVNGKAFRHFEHSLFERENGEWRYVEASEK